MTAERAHDSIRRRLPRVYLFGSLALGALVLLAYVLFCIRSPNVVLLLNENNARWIRPDEPFFYGVQDKKPLTVRYRTRFTVTGGFRGTTLNVFALGAAEAKIDGVTLKRSQPRPSNWKRPDVLQIPAALTPGTHELLVECSNSLGPPLLCASCPSLKVRSGAGWDFCRDGDETWRPAALAAQTATIAIPEELSPPPRVTLRLFAVPLFILVASALVCRWTDCCANPARWRTLLIISWLLLAGWDMSTVPSTYGFDVLDHIKYIDFIATRHRLPLATDGWQMFQTPLYYLISTPLWIATRALGLLSTRIVAMRLISIGCGAIMIEIVYRTLRIVFAGREDLQTAGLIVGGALPMNLYMMQFPSNEPFMAVIGAAMVLSVCHWLAQPNVDRPRKQALITGSLLGLAALSKVSALIWCVPVAGAFAMPLLRSPQAFRRVISTWCILAAPVAVLLGWWFVRNQLLMGTAVSVHGTLGWWQAPGYRVPSDLYSFGASLTHPIIISARSFWDSIYGNFWGDGYRSGRIEWLRMWNPRLMLWTDWLGLLPSFLMLMAALVHLLRRTASPYRPYVVFAGAGIACFLAAILNVYITLPIYSGVKASYMMSATPCFAILVAAGFNLLPAGLRKPVLVCLMTGTVLAFSTFVVAS